MPDVWMPGLIHDPGAAASYPAGTSRMLWAVYHDTGGSNSYQICKDGRAGYGNSLCNVLFPKAGTPWQFGPMNAVTYHAGSPSDYDHDGDSDDYNPYGPGFEVERFQGEPLTSDQVYWLGQVGRWLESEWGIPNVQYRGPFGEADEPTLFRGHVNHRDLHPNPDGLSPEEFDVTVASAGGSPEIGRKHKDMIIIQTKDGVWHAVNMSGGSRVVDAGFAYTMGVLCGYPVQRDVEGLAFVGQVITLGLMQRDSVALQSKIKDLK